MINQQLWSKDFISGLLIVSLLGACAVYIPFFGLIASLLIPIIMVCYRLKLGRTSGAALAVVSVVMLLVMLEGIGLDLLLLGELLIAGFVLGELFTRNLSIERTVLYSAMAIFGSGMAALAVADGLTPNGILSLLSEYISASLRLSIDLYKNMGIAEEHVQSLSQSVENLAYILIRILPAIFFSVILFQIWITMLLVKPILAIKELPYPDFGALNLWKVPEKLVWGVVGFGTLLLIPDSTVRFIGVNGLVILMTIYFFGGIAIVSYFFEQKQFPLLLKLFLYSLIGLQHILLIGVIGLGFFDLWLNFRRVKSEQ